MIEVKGQVEQSTLELPEPLMGLGSYYEGMVCAEDEGHPRKEKEILG